MKGPSPWHRIGMAAACREPISTTTAIVATVASVASTAAGIAMSYAGAQQQAAVQRSQARQADFAARQEAIRGQQQSNQIREQLLRVLASQRARFSGAGLVADEGSAMNLQEITADQAERELVVAGSNATIRSEQERLRGSLLMDAADWTETAGTINAGINLFDAVGRYGARASGTTTTPNRSNG